jgi:hypothetical protein
MTARAAINLHHRRAVRLIALVIAVTMPFVFADHAVAHGDLDQYLVGDAGCTAGNFPATADTSATPRQEFVPSGSLVSSIGVCITSSAVTSIDIAVREGSAGSPGALLGAKSVTAPLGATTYVHADFPAPLPVTAGDGYVIEVSGNASVVWRGTNPGDDLYPAGDTNAAAGDLAFRSYLAPEPPTATATNPPPTNTPTKGPTKTPTRTFTPAPTAPPAATNTPAPPPTIAVVVTPTQAAPTALAPTATGPAGLATATAIEATPTRIGVLGPAAASRIFGPDVGQGAEQGSRAFDRATIAAMALACVGSFAIVVGARTRSKHRP